MNLWGWLSCVGVVTLVCSVIHRLRQLEVRTTRLEQISGADEYQRLMGEPKKYRTMLDGLRPDGTRERN